jgi:DNA sulfur modification protein DndD
MILDKLTLRNFCLFRGKQVLDLSPGKRNGKRRPIVLFGGINGGGKTTLFDAVQLALYGSRARCSKRSNLSYEDFLLHSIHQGIGPEEGAGVALSFRHTADGEPHDYEVRRDWKLEDGRLRESVLVLQDGLPNYSVTRSWAQLVEELIPLEISQLFFFDGEKIRSLAEDASSSEALGAAIKALLGLDLVERLIADAGVLQGRLARQVAPAEQQAQVAELEGQLAGLRKQMDALRAERAALENHRQRAEVELEEARKAFAAAGGRHWEERESHAQRVIELRGLTGEIEGRLLTVAAGELPLALIPDLLARVDERDGRERLATEAEVVHRLLLERDRALLQLLGDAAAEDDLVQRVTDYLDCDRQKRIVAAHPGRRLGLSEAARALLHHLRGQRLAELDTEVRGLLDKLAHVGQEREDLERALAATPSEADIAVVVERFRKATENLTLLNETAARLDGQLNARKVEAEFVTKKLEQLWQATAKEEAEREDRQRMVTLAGRTRETMQVFLRRATERKIDRLSRLITESFRFLLRKQTLVEQILIDPGTFAITLYDAAGGALARQRLSEGEKQIFAIAMLWGLARASARPLPAVIDTPMARLDAAHRQHLVERYFPNASHQVIVLSTDTEVDRRYYEMLQPAIARAYHLGYDERSRATVAEEGYFWKE